MSKWALIVVLGISACSSGGAKPSGGDAGQRDASLPKPSDGGEPVDLATDSIDLAAADGAVPADLSSGRDLAAAADLAVPPDLRPPADLATAPDMAFPISQNVDIYVDNFCKMDVLPKKFDVPRGTYLKLTYNNRSRDYAVDVWMSYIGGYTDLKTGTSWADRFEHCRTPRPSTAWADISTACSKYRLMINCL